MIKTFRNCFMRIRNNLQHWKESKPFYVPVSMDAWVPGSCLTGEEGLRISNYMGQAQNMVTYLLLKLSIVWLGPPGWPSPRFVSFCTSLALDRLIEARSFENEALRLSLPYYKTSGRDTGGSRHEPVKWYAYRCHSIENSWYR
jgi:hypothetical protein